MKLIMLFIFFNTLVANAEDCVLAKTKIIYEGKSQIENEVLCTKRTNEKMLFYVSKSCAEDRCDILTMPKHKLEIKNYKSLTGSPGFKLCEALSGTPQIFEFNITNKNWQVSERCFFNQKDFVEISLLTAEWKKHIY